MKKLEELIDELELFIKDQEKLNPAISAGSAGWHIEHCLLTIDIVMEALRISVPAQYQPKFNLWKNIVMISKIIPRGRAKAPRSVRPTRSHSTESLLQHVVNCRKQLNVFETLNRNHHFPHPYFGQMNSNQAMKFLRIHTVHHLKIIKEILRAMC